MVSELKHARNISKHTFQTEFDSKVHAVHCDELKLEQPLNWYCRALAGGVALVL